MHGSVAQPETQVGTGERIVVLLLPEALGSFSDTALLAKTLKSRPSVRVLLCLPDASGHQFAGMLEELGVETEILLGDGATPPSAKQSYVLSAPPGTKNDDLVELALALSDAVLVPSLDDEGRLCRGATRLGKQKVVPGASLTASEAFVSVTSYLDYEVPGLHSRGRRVFGRLEQFLLDLFAFNWLGKDQDGIKKSLERLRRCRRLDWGPKVYFAPEDFEKWTPDNLARDPDAKIVERFAAMDRSALYGSYFHRDITWIVSFLAPFAILAAVIGYLKHHHFLWGIAEIGSLVVIAALIILSRRIKLQETWTACRLGAEQLRIARMSLPLLVLPPALATSDEPEEGRTRDEPEFRALSELKRVVRDHGLPRPRPDRPFTPVNAAIWVEKIVKDQIDYHHPNYHKLECVENRVRVIIETMFWIVMAAVLAHLVMAYAYSSQGCSSPPPANKRACELIELGTAGLFVIIAAVPAFAAALHGAATRLGVVHRIALSRSVERELRRIDESLLKLIGAPPNEDKAWPEIRDLTYQAAEVMGSENLSWHGLVLRYRDVLV